MARFDLGNALGGAVTGGSLFGGPGALVGGLAGGLFGKKKKKKPKVVSTLDPQQQKLYTDYQNALYGRGPLSDSYNFDPDTMNANFDANVSRPAYRSFEENIIPRITGQFRGNNLQNSSYTGQALSRAGRDVQEGLDAQRADYLFRGQQDVTNRKQNAINALLGMQTQAYQKPGPQNPSLIDQLLTSLAPAAGDSLNQYLKRFQIG